MQVRYIDKALAAAEMERIGVSRAGIRLNGDMDAVATVFGFEKLVGFRKIDHMSFAPP